MSHEAPSASAPESVTPMPEALKDVFEAFEADMAEPDTTAEKSQNTPTFEAGASVSVHRNAYDETGKMTGLNPDLQEGWTVDAVSENGMVTLSMAEGSLHDGTTGRLSKTVSAEELKAWQDEAQQKSTEQITDNSTEQTTDTGESNAETSSTGDFIVRSANRISDALNNRIVNKEERAERRAEMMESARKMLRAFGKGALKIAKAGGNLILGTGLIAGEAAYNGGKAAYEKGSDYMEDKVDAAAKYVGDKVTVAQKYVNEKVDAANAAADAINKRTEAAANKIKGSPEEVKKWWKARKESAIASRNALRKKWSDRATRAIDYVTTKKDAASGFVDRAVTAGQAAHAAGKDSWRNSAV